MNLGELIEGIEVSPAGGERTDRWARVRICDLTEDSRTAMPGSLFVARQGTKADGRAFIADALSAGAVAVLTDDPAAARGIDTPVLIASDVPAAAAQIAERFHGFPSRRLRLVGITGTNGKTTTAHLVHQVLSACGLRCGLIGTVQIDDGFETAPAELTTPPAIELSRSLANMVEAGCVAAVVEVSSHALDQQRVAALDLDVAVFTNLTGDHLDYHHDMETYAAAKCRLFAMLGPDRLAVINADDPASQRMARATRSRILSCTTHAHELATPRDTARDDGCRVQVRSVCLDGTDLVLVGPWGQAEVRTPLVGRHNAMNILEAFAAAHALGVDPARITSALASASAPAGRLQRIHDPNGKLSVLVDFAHTDDALAKVLAAVREAMGDAAGRLWVVFGCGGDKDRTKRARMGSAAGRLADRVVLTSDNPRREDPDRIIADVLEGMDVGRPGGLWIEPDRARAIKIALGRAEAGDVVVIAGKGHETAQIIPDGRGRTRTIPFDDAQVAATVLDQIATGHEVGAESPAQTGLGA